MSRDEKDPKLPDESNNLRLIGLGVVLLLLVTFVAQNFRDASVKFLWMTANTELAWAIVVAAAVGFLAGWLADRLRR